MQVFTVSNNQLKIKELWYLGFIKVGLLFFSVDIEEIVLVHFQFLEYLQISSTVKPACVVNCIKQSPVLNSHLY
jgi:hypothetical protein